MTKTKTLTAAAARKLAMSPKAAELGRVARQEALAIHMQKILEQVKVRASQGYYLLTIEGEQFKAQVAEGVAGAVDTAMFQLGYHVYRSYVPGSADREGYGAIQSGVTFAWNHPHPG
jgi:hypothetical protein